MEQLHPLSGSCLFLYMKIKAETPEQHSSHLPGTGLMLVAPASTCFHKEGSTGKQSILLSPWAAFLLQWQSWAQAQPESEMFPT